MSKGKCPESSSRRRRNDQVSELQELLSRKEEELNKTRATLDGIREERDQLRRRVHELLSDLSFAKDSRSSGSDKHSPQDLSSGTGIAHVTRKAERVRVIKTVDFKKINHEEKSKNNIHGAKLDPDKLSTAATEHLVQDMSMASGTEEVLSELDISRDGNLRVKLKENYELEMERMHCQFERLRSENGLLRLTLQESKSRTEQLQMLLSKFESNNTAHAMTLFFSELMIEVLQAYLAIIEKEVLKNRLFKDALAHAMDTNTERLKRALLGLKAIATEPLSLPAVSYNVMEFLEHCDERYFCSSGPDTVSIDITSFSEMCRVAEEKKKAVKRSIINLESFSVGSLQSPLKSEKPVSEFDLENAVLLHELASVKEELVKLKCEYKKGNCGSESSSVFHETDVDGHHVKSSSTSSFDFGLNGSIHSLNGKGTESEMTKKPNFLSLADLRIGTMAESELGTELSEALKREERLKKDNDRLAFALQQVQQNSERRHLKSFEVMQSLKASYSALLENSKKEKFKYISRLQELDRLLCFSKEQHQKETRDLKQKILTYERERENWSLPDNETAL